MAFGQNVTFLTPKPTDDIEEIKAAVAAIKTDDSGIEHTFRRRARRSIERYRPLRTQEPRRNVMLVIFTDEVGDDEDGAGSHRGDWPGGSRFRCIASACRLRSDARDASVKYVDPDPKYDQTPQWIQRAAGPRVVPARAGEDRRRNRGSRSTRALVPIA